MDVVKITNFGDGTTRWFKDEDSAIRSVGNGKKGEHYVIEKVRLLEMEDGSIIPQTIGMTGRFLDARA